MTPNKRDLKAYSRFDGTGRIVPGSTVLRRSKPKNGKWKEVQAYECCDTFQTTCIEPLIMEIISDGDLFEFGIRVWNGNKVKGTIEWGDGTSETFDLTGTSYTSYFSHFYSTNQNIPHTVKVYFTSTDGFRNLEIGQGDLVGTLLSVSNIPTVFAGSTIQQVDADVQDIISLDVSNLPITQLYALGCPNLRYLNVQGCTQLEDTELYDDNFEVLDFTGCAVLQSASVSNNVNLYNLMINGCTSLTFLDAGGCAFSEGSVDAILAELDANGLSNGEVYLDGGTSSSPSVAGLASKSNLEGKGWTIYVN